MKRTLKDIDLSPGSLGVVLDLKVTSQIFPREENEPRQAGLPQDLPERCQSSVQHKKGIVQKQRIHFPFPEEKDHIWVASTTMTCMLF